MGEELKTPLPSQLKQAKQQPKLDVHGDEHQSIQFVLTLRPL
jgi:hypothetical protein